jgi:hypothetical protein
MAPVWENPIHKNKLALRPEFTPLELGIKIYEAHARGVPMKELGRQYGYGHTRLWQLHKLAKQSMNDKEVESPTPS